MSFSFDEIVQIDLRFSESLKKWLNFIKNNFNYYVFKTYITNKYNNIQNYAYFWSVSHFSVIAFIKKCKNI